MIRTVASSVRRVATPTLRSMSSGSGLNFNFTDDQRAFQELARTFAREEMMPKAAEYDLSMKFPHEVFDKAWELGLVNCHIPEECGGMGLHTVDGCIMQEELAYGCSAMSTAVEANTLAQMPVILAGNDEQKKKFLGRCVDAPVKVAYGVSEPGAGSDVANIQTTAKQVGDDFVINGSKIWITNGGVAKESGGWYFVLAVTDKSARAGGRMTGFIVDADTPGITVGAKLVNMGQRCSDTRPLFFEDGA